MKEERSELHMQEKQRCLKQQNFRNLDPLIWPGKSDRNPFRLQLLIGPRFSDVTHEVNPVLSSRRLVLTYNLIHDTLRSKELGVNSNAAMANLRLLLSAWIKAFEKNEEMPTSQAFLLEHQCTDASLCYDGLKGHDQQVASHLREACDESGFCFYLANLDKKVSGGCEGDYEDDYYGGRWGGGGGTCNNR